MHNKNNYKNKGIIVAFTFIFSWSLWASGGVKSDVQQNNNNPPTTQGSAWPGPL